jgi:hypothetical protein
VIERKTAPSGTAAGLKGRFKPVTKRGRREAMIARSASETRAALAIGIWFAPIPAGLTA